MEKNKMNEEKIIVETSTKTNDFGKKPRIEEGIYKGILTEIKKRVDKEGNPIIGKWGNKQAILIFTILDKKTDTIVTYKNDNNEEVPAKLAQVINISYKKEEQEEISAFTPKSQSTQVFKALGWEGPKEGENLVLNDYLNKACKVFVEDYEIINEDGSKTVASRIHKIGSLVA
jgi:hypothetical protein